MNIIIYHINIKINNEEQDSLLNIIKEVKNIKKKLGIILLFVIVLILISPVNAENNDTQPIAQECKPYIESVTNSSLLEDASSDLENRIHNADNNEEILIEPGTYKIHNINITKNITLQGNSNDPRDVVIDGEEKSSIFLIRSPDVHVTFKNITFINGLTDNFGGAISIETGHAYVDNCIFMNNTALEGTNAGAISNYGTKENRGYLFVNNTLFLNNHADHDGGAVTTCYADSDIYNCVFINNSAVRDGGAIRVSVFGYGNVQDCIFMFNHADEWGGAYYSWSGESNIERCIFMNNTAGTNGGAVMVSGNINLQDSIIVNNEAGETGGSFYLQNPMYYKPTVINVQNNIITNNSSPYGKEIFIKWKHSEYLYPQFENNDWGDENPNDSDVNDPNNVTSRIKVSNTIKSDLFERLNVNLLNRYADLLGGFFQGDSMDNLKNQFKTPENNKVPDTSTPETHGHANQNTSNTNENPVTASGAHENIESNQDTSIPKNSIPTTENKKDSINANSEFANAPYTNQIVYGNSTSQGEYEKAYELNETGGSVAKQIKSNITYFIALLAIALVLLAIGYKRNKRLE
jgi:predicted outer membrane repeat protein